MKRFALHSNLALALVVALAPFFAADAADETAAPDAPTAEQQKAMEAMCAVNENHKLLNYMVGDWTTDTVQFSETGKETSSDKGTCKSKAIMGGRFFVSEHKSKMFGQDWEGIATSGYDNAEEKFVGTFIDNFCTHIVYSIGTYDAPSKTFKFEAEMADPMVGKGKKATMKEVVKILNDDKHVIEFFMKKDAKDPEYKFMEITYNRVK